ncbi:hypothetical protein FOZ62_020127, partial [Perkinsus olseni]
IFLKSVRALLQRRTVVYQYETPAQGSSDVDFQCEHYRSEILNTIGAIGASDVRNGQSDGGRDSFLGGIEGPEFASCHLLPSLSSRDPILVNVLPHRLLGPKAHLVFFTSCYILIFFDRGLIA